MSLGIVLVFDLGKPETFEHLKERMPEIAQNAGFIPIILMGTNKEVEADGVMIPSMDIDQFMFKYGISHYYRISMKTGEGIQSTFETLSDTIIKETIRKLGPEEVKQKSSFSFAIAMIGDECIRKDWISEFGVQRFAAPSTMGGAISRKMLDRDINHLLPEPRMDKKPYTTAIPPPSPPGAAVGGGGIEKDKEELQTEFLNELESLKKVKAEEIEREKQELETIMEIKQQMKGAKKEEEVVLEKPSPLQPLEFKKAEEATDLPQDLKNAIEEEVRRVREDISGEKKKEKPEIYRDAPPPPSPAPQPKATPPPPPPPPSKAIPTPAAPVDKYVSVKDKRKKKARVGRAKLKRPVSKDLAADMEPSPMDDDATVDMEGVIDALHEKTGLPKEEIDEHARPIVTDPLATTSIIESDAVLGEAMADEFEEEEDADFGALAGAGEMEITTEKLLRKTTVFYRERMNPETLNKLAVILSSEKIYEKLKIKIDEIARAATDKALEIDKELPIVEVVPEFPGCVCVPSVRKLNAEKEYDAATFLITPLQTGDIPDAKVKLYHKGKLIETIPCPAKVVKTTAAKISAGAAVVVPLLSQIELINAPLSAFLSGIIPFYGAIGGLEGIVLILTGLFALIGGIIYLFKRPKDAKPVETFPELDEKLDEIH